jgi:hypothetical protein
MAITVQDIIDSARYDLVDFVDGIGVGIEFDDEELLNYLNRMVGLMDSQLSALQSDLVEAEELDIDTVESQSYIDISALYAGLYNRIRSVWIGSTRLEQTTLNYMRYTRRYRSGDAKPTIWALWNDQILFPSGADSAHVDVAIYYDKKSAVLTLSGSMPYNDRFNEFFREMLVMTAKAKKEGIIDRSDSLLNEMFRSRAVTEEIQRGFIPKQYVYWEF